MIPEHSHYISQVLYTDDVLQIARFIGKFGTLEKFCYQWNKKY